MTINSPKRKTPDVPILPMVDLLSILLVFFIVTSEFKKEDNQFTANASSETELGINIDLPTTKQLPSTQIKTQFTKLAIKSINEMELDGVSIKSLDELMIVLKGQKILDQDQKIQLITDQTVSIQSLLQVWDALTEAGYSVKDTPFRISASKAKP